METNTSIDVIYSIFRPLNAEYLIFLLGDNMLELITFLIPDLVLQMLIHMLLLLGLKIRLVWLSMQIEQSDVQE